MRRHFAGWLAVVGLWLLAEAPAALAAPRVLRVGSYHGVPGSFRTIQAAVDAAKPGDWVLVGPGDYKTTAVRAPAGRATEPAGVLITTPDLYLRGMNRNTVVVDGTKPGSTPCSKSASAQNLGPTVNGKATGLNGIMVFEANDVWVQNLTACNFLGGAGTAGNEIWWNGGDGSSKIGGSGYLGSYLNATSTYFADEATAAEYGIFSSNWNGGTWDRTYASNMNDSGYYIGACRQVCNQVVDRAWAEYNALGYSGSNSGGSLIVENSQFDNNKDGFDTNSQNGDEPSPQNGACPDNGVSPITHTHSCWVFMHNYVHDNNDANVPNTGLASFGPDGTGMSLSGGRNDTVMDNTFANNNAWGLIVLPFLDSTGAPCTGGTTNLPIPGSCLYDDWGDAVVNNTFTHDGSFGHNTNGDIAWLNLENGHPTPCFTGNTDTSGTLTTSPANLQSSSPTCDGHAVNGNGNSGFLLEALCDSGVQLVAGLPPVCPSGPYPVTTTINNGLHPLPTASLPTMANPCAGAPASPWCSGVVTRVSGCAASRVSVPLALAPGERLVSVSVRVGHRRFRSARRVSLGAPHRTVRVRVTETVKVGHHRERFSFTRVYKRC